MYLEHYKLSVKPFQITVDPKFLWLGEKHKEALATLRYGIIDNRGFLLLTGEVGTGKTILINRLVSLLDVDTIVARLPDPNLESMDFYNLLADGLGMNRTFESKASFFIHFRDFLYQSHARQQQVLLIIDESQRLNHRLMEDIRVLSNVELQDRKLINIFFVGQQEFNTTLLKPHNRALAQRITVRYHIEPLDRKETGEYIAHRLKVAGAGQTLFKESTIEKVYLFSGGIPRLINIICDHALLTGYAQGVKQIDGRIVQECAEELRIPAKSQNGTAKQEIQSSGADRYAERPHDGIDPKKTHLIKKPDTTPIKRLDTRGDQERKNVISRFFYFVLIMLALISSGIAAATYFLHKKQPHYESNNLILQQQQIATHESEKKAPDNGLKVSGPSAPVVQEPDNKKDEKERLMGETIPVVEISKTPPAPDDSSQKISSSTGPSEKTEAKATLITKTIREIKPLPLIEEKIVIVFTVNSNEIDQESYDSLDRIAVYMAAHPSKKINIRGYTDSTGSETYNESVSRFRTSTVKSYLLGKGVEDQRMVVYAMGAINPIASNDTAAGRRLNRRVEIEIVQHPLPNP